jgi:membrane-associated phospholipid phosphatase
MPVSGGSWVIGNLVAWTHRGILLALAAVAALTASVVGSATVRGFDFAANAAVHHVAVRREADFSFAVTWLGNSATVLWVTILAVGVLAALRHWRGAAALALAFAATQLVVDLIKTEVQRPRPGHAITDPSGFSFPSAHSASSVALYALLAFILARAARGSTRTALIVAGLAVAAAVGLSRVYLGAHYPTDVLAGWLTGGVLAAASWALVSRLRVPAPMRAREG